MPHQRGRLSSIVGVALLFMSLTAIGQQRWYEVYDDGIVAFGRMQWLVAEQKFKAALAIKPAQEQGQRVLFYGTRREPYLPEYYLVQVYLKLGRNKEAVDLLAKVERDARITPRDPQFKELKTLIAGIQAPVTVVAGGRGDSGLPPAANAPDGGAPARGAVGGQPPGGPVPGGVVPGGVVPGGAPAAPAAIPAPTIAVADNTTPPTGVVPPVGGSAASAPATGGGPGPGSPGNVGTAAAGRTAVAPPASLPAHPSASLEKAALQAFFQGNYRAALSLLDSSVFKQNPTPRRLFYVACSNAALGLLEGENGRSRITAARIQFAEARGLDPQFAVDRRYISPRILDTLSARR